MDRFSGFHFFLRLHTTFSLWIARKIVRAFKQKTRPTQEKKGVDCVVVACHF